MLNTLSIRSAREADYEQWLILWGQYNEFYGRANETALPIEISDTTWSRFFESDDVFCLIATIDGQICGIAHCVYHYVTTSIKKSCYLNDLFTIESLRGRGIGKALIAAVYARALKEGAARVYWQTKESNANARALYDQVADYEGFIVYKHMLPQAAFQSQN